MIGTFSVPGRLRRVAVPLLAGALLAVPAFLSARIDLVTLPGRDATMITVYNSEDLTLVREQRTLSFAEGPNQIQFSWANTLIDPTSLRLDFPNSPELAVVEAVYPPGANDRVIWNINAERATAGTVEITYFISGLTWSARYHALVNSDETAFNLQQYTTVRNDSGEDFENTSVRVVVGEVNLTESIAELARLGIARQYVIRELMASGRAAGVPVEMFFDSAMAASPMATSSRASRTEAREVIQRAVSEYKLYTVDGEVDILNGWGQRLPSRPITGVSFDLSYEIDTAVSGGTPMKVYRLRNNTTHELGRDALPEGEWYITGEDGRGGLRFEGNTSHKYIPIGDEIELNLGADGLVLFTEKLLRRTRRDFDMTSDNNIAGWLEESVHQLEVRNTRERAVPVKLTFRRGGDWELVNAPSGVEVLDANSLRWEINVPANDILTLDITLLQRMGTKQSSPRPPAPVAPLGGPRR